MAKEKVQLGALKEEIKNRKEGKKRVAESAGLPVDGKEPKDAFLKELVDSLKRGQPGRATNMIKMVEEKTSVVSGEPTPTNTGSQTMSQVVNNPAPVVAPRDGEERDALLFEEMERRKREMQQNRGQGAAPSSDGLTMPAPQQNVSLNEGYINEVVARAINENVSYLVEQALKDTIIDIYVGERMKETIMENEKMIENIVIETIRKLQKKKPA